MNSRGVSLVIAVQLGHRGGPNSPADEEEERPFSYLLQFRSILSRRISMEARARNSRKNRVRDFNESSPRRIASSIIPQTIRISSYPIPSVASRQSGIGEYLA